MLALQATSYLLPLNSRNLAWRELSSSTKACSEWRVELRLKLRACESEFVVLPLQRVLTPWDNGCGSCELQAKEALSKSWDIRETWYSSSPPLPAQHSCGLWAPTPPPSVIKALGAKPCGCCFVTRQRLPISLRSRLIISKPPGGLGCIQPFLAFTAGLCPW